jgi:hypothetical protein
MDKSNDLLSCCFLLRLFHIVIDSAAYLFATGKTYYALGLLVLIVPQIILQVSILLCIIVWFVLIDTPSLGIVSAPIEGVAPIVWHLIL